MVASIYTGAVRAYDVTRIFKSLHILALIDDEGRVAGGAELLSSPLSLPALDGRLRELQDPASHEYEDQDGDEDEE